MKNLIVALILCLGFLSCNKESKVPLTPETKLLVSGKKITVYLYKNKVGQTLNFNTGYHTAVAADDMTDALWYVHNMLVTSDSSHAYQYPFTSVTAKNGFLYAYPDSVLQASSGFPDFEAWFQMVVTKWMSKHECTGCANITVSPGSPDYFMKISCTVQ